MPYNIKQLGEKSVSIDFFIADPNFGVVACEQESSHALFQSANLLNGYMVLIREATYPASIINGYLGSRRQTWIWAVLGWRDHSVAARET